MHQGKQHSLLIVIDMQNALLQRAIYKKTDLLCNADMLITACHSAGIPVAFLRHTNKTFAVKDTDGWQLSPALSVGESDLIIDKTKSNPFQQKEFVELMYEKRYRHLIICGLLTNGCVQVTCTDALKYGFVVTLISDAHSTWIQHPGAVIEEWNQKLAGMGAHLMTTEEAVARWSKGLHSQ